MKKRAGLYCRVSTNSQTTENQKSELVRYCQRQGWQVQEIYEDKGVSGAAHDRPALDNILEDARNGRLDVVVVWKIDRLARSTAHLLEILTMLRANQVDFCSATQAIDTTTSYGKMVMTFLGAIAEFERELTVERVKAGLERAKSNGTRLGRPRVGFDVGKALSLRRQGLGYKQIAAQLGVARTTVYRTLGAIPQTPALVEA